MLVVDPIVAEIDKSSPPQLVAVAHEFPYLPVVFYVSDPVRSLSAVARFPSRERCDALVSGVDDDVQSIGAVLESAVGSSLVGKLLRDVGLADADLPGSFKQAVRQVFASPSAFRDVDAIAATACMSRRTLDRWLERCGAVPAAELLQVARALLAIRLLRDEDVDRDRVYQACGWAPSRPIAWYVGQATGVSVRITSRLQDSDLLISITARLRRNGESNIDRPMRDTFASERLDHGREAHRA